MMKLKLILLLLLVLANLTIQNQKCKEIDCVFPDDVCLQNNCGCGWPYCIESKDSDLVTKEVQIPKIIKGELHVEVAGKLHVVDIKPSSSFNNVAAQVGNLSFNFSMKRVVKKD